MRYVYILKCNDNRLYIGCTDNLKERFQKHNKGYVIATKKKLPVVLLNYVAFINKQKAFSFEKYLKSSSGRAFINKHIL